MTTLRWDTYANQNHTAGIWSTGSTQPSTGPDVRFLYKYAPQRTPKLVPCWWAIVPFTLTVLFGIFAVVTPSHDLWGALALIALAAYAVLREPRVPVARTSRSWRSAS